jgi:hypothetical protein
MQYTPGGVVKQLNVSERVQRSYTAELRWDMRELCQQFV